MTIQVHQKSVSASEAEIRGHRLVIDRPTDKGGSDLGPMGGELFLAAIGGCFMSNLLAAIDSRQAQVSDIHTEVTGTVDAAPARFSRIELQVSGECADRELFQKLIGIAERGCIMVNTLRAGIDLEIRIAVRA